jgi:ATP-dependent Zn protease
MLPATPERTGHFDAQVAVSMRDSRGREQRLCSEWFYSVGAATCRN